MQSDERGLTLIEILIVLGLTTIVAGFALMVSFDTYRDSTYHADRASLIAALEHARAQSLDDVCMSAGCTQGVAHGVSIQAGRYVIFEGTSYAARDASLDEIIDANPSVAHSGLLEVVFAPSSGDAADPGTIVLADTSGRVSTTTIGAEGQISWSN